jgi:hypothetical protein
LEEIHTLLSERLEDLKQNPKWGEGEREELVSMLDEVGDQIEDLAEALQAEGDEGDADNED